MVSISSQPQCVKIYVQDSSWMRFLVIWEYSVLPTSFKVASLALGEISWLPQCQWFHPNERVWIKIHIAVTSPWPPKAFQIHRLFFDALRLTSKKSSKPALLVLCEGNPPVTGGFISQRASNTENVSISCRHNDLQETKIPLKQHKSHLSKQYTCWSLRCSWSIDCRRCSNYIFIPTQHLASNDWAKTTVKRDEKHLSFEIRCAIYKRFDGKWRFSIIPSHCHQRFSPKSSGFLIALISPTACLFVIQIWWEYPVVPHCNSDV